MHGQYYSLQVGDEATEALLEEVADSLEDASAIVEKPTFVVEAPSLTSRVRLYFDQDQDQDSLLVKRRNDNHSPGPVIRELVPSSHQKSELSNTILCIFSE